MSYANLNGLADKIKQSDESDFTAALAIHLVNIHQAHAYGDMEYRDAIDLGVEFLFFIEGIKH